MILQISYYLKTKIRKYDIVQIIQFHCKWIRKFPSFSQAVAIMNPNDLDSSHVCFQINSYHKLPEGFEIRTS
jgi:hypothetical protein